MAAIDDALDKAAVRPGFIAALTFAQIGAYVSFVPLLQILLPLKAAAIDPAHKAVTLAHISFWGATAAGLANLIAGAVSDRTTSRLGRRRPWLLAGVAGTLTAYFAIERAGDVLGLMAGMIFSKSCSTSCSPRSWPWWSTACPSASAAWSRRCWALAIPWATSGGRP